MKNVSVAFLLFVTSILSTTFITSCSKTVTKTVTVTDTVRTTVTDTVTKIAVNNSTLFLFTSKRWIVDSVYTNYTGANSGTLVYAKGNFNHTSIDYSTISGVFWPDGTTYYFTGATYTPYTWSFTNSDSTEILVVNTAQDYGRILSLSTNYLVLYDSTNTSLVHYAYEP
jgi:hypothetical protein